MDDASVVSRQVKARQPRRRDRLDARGHRPRLAPKGAKASAKPKSGPNGNIGEVGRG